MSWSYLLLFVPFRPTYYKNETGMGGWLQVRSSQLWTLAVQNLDTSWMAALQCSHNATKFMRYNKIYVCIRLDTCILK